MCAVVAGRLTLWLGGTVGGIIYIYTTFGRPSFYSVMSIAITSCLVLFTTVHYHLLLLTYYYLLLLTTI